MKEKPIIFSTPEVQAILDGSKTQTRRVIRPQPVLKSGFWGQGGTFWSENIKQVTPVPCHSLYNKMPYKPGDILWVRETWSDFFSGIHIGNPYIYRADEDRCSDQFRWKPSSHMPREAARLFLEVKAVRVERLNDITEEDVEAERFEYHEFACVNPTKGIGACSCNDSIDQFSCFWDSLNAKRGYSWESNPWVWVYEFRRLDSTVAERATP